MCAGIGRNINSIDQIEEITRPVTMEEGGIVLMDLLWSGEAPYQQGAGAPSRCLAYKGPGVPAQLLLHVA